MCLTLSTVLFASFVVAAPPRSSDQFDARDYASKDIYNRDVAINGGGSSGTYAAIDLQMLGKSVIVFEKANKLGGPVATYIDPSSGTSVDYGVQSFWNISLTQNYFNYLGISYSNMTAPKATTTHVDFATGAAVNVIGSDERGQQSTTDYSAYLQHVRKYPELAYSWDIPYPGGSGFANMLRQPTIDAMKIVGDSYIASMQGGAVRTTDQNNQEIYGIALRLDGHGNASIKLGAKGASGGSKLIQAKKFLISIPPLLSNLQPFSLTNSECNLFSQWTYSSYYSMLITNTGLPSNYRILNAVASNSTYHIPQTPAPYFISATKVPGLFYAWYASPKPLSQTQVQADITSVIQRLRKTANSLSTATPEFVQFRDNSPFMMVLPKQASADGVYKKLKTVQGQRNTWYTGAAWVSYESPVLWNFTQNLLPDIIA